MRTLISKPIGWPALTTASSATFAASRSGQFTLTDAVEALSPRSVSPSVLTMAVLLMSAWQSSAAEAAEREIVRVALAASGPKLQERSVPPASTSPAARAEPFAEQSAISAPPTVQL